MTRETPVPESVVEPIARHVARKLIAMRDGGMVARAVDAAFAAHARTNLLPSRKSVRELAAAALYGAIDAEISRRLARARR